MEMVIILPDTVPMSSERNVLCNKEQLRGETLSPQYQRDLHAHLQLLTQKPPSLGGHLSNLI